MAYPWQENEIRLKACGMREAISRVFLMSDSNVNLQYKRISNTELTRDINRIDSFSVAIRMRIEDFKSFLELSNVIGLKKRKRAFNEKADSIIRIDKLRVD